MPDFIAIVCPYCGESFDLSTAGEQDGSAIIVDCETCCRPISIQIRMTLAGPEAVDITPA